MSNNKDTTGMTIAQITAHMVQKRRNHLNDRKQINDKLRKDQEHMNQLEFEGVVRLIKEVDAAMRAHGIQVHGPTDRSMSDRYHDVRVFGGTGEGGVFRCVRYDPTGDVYHIITPLPIGSQTRSDHDLNYGDALVYLIENIINKYISN